MIKSPLRYPGGKSKAIAKIIEYLPETFSEYREPFVGGGSLFIYLKQKFPDLNIWINDLNTELFLFWKTAQVDLEKLVKEIFYIKNTYQDGKLLFQELTQVDVRQLSDLQRAVRFFVLNRITFSGTVESGGFSQQAFQRRFTMSSIERLEKLSSILPRIKITNLDYSYLLGARSSSPQVTAGSHPLLASQRNDTFIFLDPPYFTATKSRLYGKQGNLHTSFDHQRFAKLMKECSCSWLITYDDSPKIRENFQFSTISKWKLQYGMNNYKQDSAAKGNELFLYNYSTKQSSKATTNSNFKSTEQLSLFYNLNA